MIEILVGVICTVLFCLVWSGGWCAVLFDTEEGEWQETLFAGCIPAFAGISVVWAFGYPNDVAPHAVNAAFLALGLLGYGLAVWMRRPLDLRSRLSTVLQPTTLAALAIVLVVASPAMLDLEQGTAALRTGPDAIGYTTTVNGLSNGLTQRQLHAEIIEGTETSSMDEAMASGEFRIYAVPSFSTQVEGEFLEASNRWSFGGAGSLVSTFRGPGHVISTASIIVVSALLVALLGIHSAISNITKRRVWAWTGVLLCAANVSLLHSWHEGGLGQVWVLPGCVALGAAVAGLDRGSSRSTIVLVALGVAIILPAYSDALLLYGLVFGVLFLVSVPVLRRRWWSMWWPFLTGGLVGALIVLPSALALLEFLVRRLEDSQRGGWPQPRWAGPLEVLGIWNYYGTGIPGLVDRSTLENVAIRIGDGAAVILAIGLWIRARRSLFGIAFASVGVALVVMYVRTRILTDSHNYSYFKAIAMLTPLIGIFLPLLVHAAVGRIRRPLGSRFVLASFGTIVVFATLAGLQYVRDYRCSGSQYPLAVESVGVDDSVSRVFDRYNVLGVGTLDIAMVGAVTDFTWLNRYLNSPYPPVNAGQVADRPLGLLITLERCGRFSCLTGIEESSIVFRNDQFAVIHLDATTDPRHATDGQWSRSWTSEVIVNAGGEPSFLGLP